MSVPLPNEWLGEAWKAIVGYFGVRCWMYRAFEQSAYQLQRNNVCAYRDPVWHQIALVQDKHDLLVRLFLLDIVQDRLAHCPQRVPGIKDMQNHIRRVNDFVEFAINPARCALGIDRLKVVGVSLNVRDIASQRFCEIYEINGDS